MLISRKSALVIGGVVLILAITSSVILFFGSNKRVGQPAPTPETISSASAIPETLAPERAALTQLSDDLAAKYASYDRPDSPAYFASLKPYLVEDYYNQLVANNTRLAAKFPVITPVRSQAKRATFTSLTQQEAKVMVTISTQEPTSGKSYQQTVEIHWTRVGDRWSADFVGITDSTKRERL